VNAEDDFPRLLAGLRAGDPAAVEILYRRYGPVLRAAVRRRLHPRLRDRLDSVDVVQDVWASFLAIPPGRLNFDTPNALVAYLGQVAYHRVVELFRKRFGTERDAIAREVATTNDQLRGATPTPSTCAAAGEEWERLVSQFPPGYRVILHRLREGHDYRDIARMANVSVRTVNRVVARLREMTGA
jgi:RNA polymerase sigma factor (sigma-70 family)